jgi:replication factor C subunit 2/4
MFGDLFKQRVLELNASDERGIDVIRTKVKMFSHTTVMGRNSKAPMLKIVILDEADSMTQAAQAALRRTMEKECKSTRFCLICNYISRIIEPITSRCSKFRFKSLTNELVQKKLKEISEAEGIKLESDEVLDELIDVSEGDLRKAITLLHTLFRQKSTGKPGSEHEAITKSDVREVTGYIPDEWIEKFVDTARLGEVDPMAALIKQMVYEGFPAGQFLIQLQARTLLVKDDHLTNVQKAMIAEKIADTDHCLLEGADEYLQLLNLGILLIEILQV